MQQNATSEAVDDEGLLIAKLKETDVKAPDGGYPGLKGVRSVWAKAVCKFCRVCRVVVKESVSKWALARARDTRTLSFGVLDAKNW